MYKCPVCGAYLNFNMGYDSLCQPYPYNTCSCCGYDSRVSVIRTTTSTSSGNVQIRPTCTSASLNALDRIFEYGNEKTIFSNADSVFG